jgi:hypothetical protein
MGRWRPRRGGGNAPGRERDELLKKLRNAETAMHLKDWAESPGLQALK